MTVLRRLSKALILAALTLPAGLAAMAHEFWIEPLDYTIEVGDRIEARLRNGQNFEGSAYPYIENWFSSFALVTRAGAAPVKSRNGDNPAVSQTAETGGLHILAYDGAMNRLTYDSWDRFLLFLDEVGLKDHEQTHLDRGFPKEGVKEAYYRYPKALVKVGSGAGRDKRLGLLFELVAETNPYSDAAQDGVRVRLYYKGEPYAGSDIQIFHYADGEEEAVKHHATTDATGRALIPAFDRGPFLINATLIRDPRPEGAEWGAMWESLWATMTYELPK